MNLLLLLLPLLLSRFINLLFPMDMKWYEELKKSPYTPDGKIFGIVWFILYLLIGWGFGQNNPEWLILNFIMSLMWLIVYNGKKNITAGFWILLAMGLTMVTYLQKTGQYLLLPYLIWLLFATYLNYYIMDNNPDQILNSPIQMNIGGITEKIREIWSDLTKF